MSDATRVVIPPRTRLEAVWWNPATGDWQVWTACKDRNAMFADMTGTCLVLHSNGAASRMTINPDGTIRLHEVKP